MPTVNVIDIDPVYGVKWSLQKGMSKMLQPHPAAFITPFPQHPTDFLQALPCAIILCHVNLKEREVKEIKTDPSPQPSDKLVWESLVTSVKTTE